MNSDCFCHFIFSFCQLLIKMFISEIYVWVIRAIILIGRETNHPICSRFYSNINRVSSVVSQHPTLGYGQDIGMPETNVKWNKKELLQIKKLSF